MNKFLLAENPMRSEQSGLFIIHMLDPITIIECKTETTYDDPDKIWNAFYFKNSDGITEQWALSIYHFFTKDFLEKPEDRALKLLDCAWRWYRSYMEWEDENTEEMI